jgi:hypothetical protein
MPAGSGHGMGRIEPLQPAVDPIRDRGCTGELLQKIIELVAVQAQDGPISGLKRKLLDDKDAEQL